MENRIFVYENNIERQIYAKDQLHAVIERAAFPLLALGRLEGKIYHRVLGYRYKGRFATIYLTCCAEQYYFVVEVLPSEHSRVIFKNLKASSTFTAGGMQYFVVPHEKDPKMQLQRMEQLVKRFEDLFFEFHAEAVKTVKNIVDSGAFKGKREGINIVQLGQALQASDAALAKANYELKLKYKEQQAEIEMLAVDIARSKAEKAVIEAQLAAERENIARIRGQSRYKEVKRKKERQELDEKQRYLQTKLSQLEEIRRSASVTQRSDAANQSGGTHSSRSASVQSRPIKPFSRFNAHNDLQPGDLDVGAPPDKGATALTYEQANGSLAANQENLLNGGSTTARAYRYSEINYLIKSKQERVDLRQNQLVQNIRSLAKQQLQLRELLFGPEVSTVAIARAPELTYLELPPDSKLYSIEVTSSGLIQLFVGRQHGFDAYLQNLRILNLSFTQVVTLPLESMPNLTALDVSWTSIEALSLASLPRLTGFSCSNSRVVSINTSANPELERIDTAYTRISQLCFDKNPKLAELTIDSTCIQQIDLANNPRLTRFSARNTHIAELDFTNNSQLHEIDVSGSTLEELHLALENSVTRIDASLTKLHNLDILKSAPQLTIFRASCTEISGKADMSANKQLQELDLSRTALTEVVLTGLDQLSRLDVSFTAISRVDVRGLEALRTLLCQPECRVLAESDGKFFEDNRDAKRWQWEKDTPARGITVG